MPTRCRGRLRLWRHPQGCGRSSFLRHAVSRASRALATEAAEGTRRPGGRRVHGRETKRRAPPGRGKDGTTPAFAIRLLHAADLEAASTPSRTPRTSPPSSTRSGSGRSPASRRRFRRRATSSSAVHDAGGDPRTATQFEGFHNELFAPIDVPLLEPRRRGLLPRGDHRRRDPVTRPISRPTSGSRATTPIRPWADPTPGRRRSRRHHAGGRDDHLARRRDRDHGRREGHDRPPPRRSGRTSTRRSPRA